MHVSKLPKQSFSHFASQQVIFLLSVSQYFQSENDMISQKNGMILYSDVLLYERKPEIQQSHHAYANQVERKIQQYPSLFIVKDSQPTSFIFVSLAFFFSSPSFISFHKLPFHIQWVFFIISKQNLNRQKKKTIKINTHFSILCLLKEILKNLWVSLYTKNVNIYTPLHSIFYFICMFYLLFLTDFSLPLLIRSVFHQFYSSTCISPSCSP